jgi:hypothetical protein
LVFQLRISHVKSMATTVVGVVLGVALLAFTFWVYRSLTSPAVMEARRAAGVNAQKPIIAFVGGALAVGLISVLIVMAQRTNGSVAP